MARPRMADEAREQPPPGQRAGKRRDPQGEGQRAVDGGPRIPGGEPGPEVLLGEAAKLRAARWQARLLRGRAQGDKQAAERVRDRGVAPVKRGPGVREDVVGVQVGVVQAGRDAEVAELRAPLAQPRRQRAQGLVLGAGDAAGASITFSMAGSASSCPNRPGTLARRRSGRPRASRSATRGARPSCSCAYAGSMRCQALTSPGPEWRSRSVGPPSRVSDQARPRSTATGAEKRSGYQAASATSRAGSKLAAGGLALNHTVPSLTGTRATTEYDRHRPTAGPRRASPARAHSAPIHSSASASHSGSRQGGTPATGSGALLSVNSTNTNHPERVRLPRPNPRML